MKNVLIYSTLILSLLLCGCPKPGSGVFPEMKATINGKAFESPTIVNGLQNGNQMMIRGGYHTPSRINPSVFFTLSDYKGVGTYIIDGTNITAGIDSTNDANAQKIAAGAGSIMITATSPQITGTFQFTCTDGTVVTDGYFACKKQ